MTLLTPACVINLAQSLQGNSPMYKVDSFILLSPLLIKALYSA